MNPQAKRNAIMACGERLFAEQGYTRTTMAEVARAAAVAVGTVYRLFPDKPSLLVAMHRRMEDRFIDAMLRGWASTDHVAARFGPMIEALFDEATVVRDIMPLYTMTRDVVGAADFVPGARIIETIDKLLREGQRSGAFRDGCPGIQAPIAHAMVEGGMRAWMLNPTPERAAQVKAELESLFCRAFLTDD